MVSRQEMLAFPDYGECDAKRPLDGLRRLVNLSVFDTEYIDARSAAALASHALSAYVKALGHERWETSPVLSRLSDPKRRFNLFCAALFDIICNAEYIRGRVTNSSWIYCNRHRDGEGNDLPYAYYSFLKQCPKCCQDKGLEDRLSGAQHKPTSHHIGEITTVATTLILKLLGACAPKPLKVSTISKQSHDVDALAWRDDLLVLLEIKASPLVTYPLRVQLTGPFRGDGPDGPVEVRQHKLIDVEYQLHDISLYLANSDRDIPLGKPDSKAWPYPEMSRYIEDARGLLDYLEAWGEIFLSYSVPKTVRVGRGIAMGYLANGWGDEIDSNKTKAGLGRTDDIKKGTYQLLKFGAYYRSGSPNLPVRGALAANLDPLFLYNDYMEKLVDARWAPASKFQQAFGKPDRWEISDHDLFYIYDAVLAFNRPIINDSALAGAFDFGSAEKALLAGRIDPIKVWATL